MKRVNETTLSLEALRTHSECGPNSPLYIAVSVKIETPCKTGYFSSFAGNKDPYHPPWKPRCAQQAPVSAWLQLHLCPPIP